MTEITTYHEASEVPKAYNFGELIKNVMDRQHEETQFNPQINNKGAQELLRLRERWNEEEATVAMVFGTFDVPFHVNHQSFLIDCKMQGAVRHYQRFFEEDFGPWEAQSKESQYEFTKQVLSEGSVKLIVSSDGDDRVALSKGNNPLKGGSPRPLQSWWARANSLSNFALDLSGDGSPRRVVDALTIHDHITLDGTPHQSPKDLVTFLKPDIWTLFYEAKSDIQLALTDPELQDVPAVVIHGNQYSQIDPFTGKHYSTTGLVKRVMGQV